MPQGDEKEWLYTRDGSKRGWIMPQKLEELWIHTGTACNLSCPFCFEHSGPDDRRLEQMTFNDAVKPIDQACGLGVEQIAFTGGEPFLNKDIMAILDYVLERRPSLMLTNGSAPMLKRIAEIVRLKNKPFKLTLRISVDYPDSERHDAGRGKGNFAKSLQAMKILSEEGFQVTAARIYHEGENNAAIEAQYRELFRKNGIPGDAIIVRFPLLPLPEEHPHNPEITEDCVRNYCNAAKIAAFMCSYSKMAVKRNGRIAILPCTLVDDDEMYDLGGELEPAMSSKIMLKHPRCFACISEGVQCGG